MRILPVCCGHARSCSVQKDYLYQWRYDHVEILQVSVFRIPEHWAEHVNQQLDTHSNNTTTVVYYYTLR